MEMERQNFMGSIKTRIQNYDEKNFEDIEFVEVDIDETDNQ